MAFVFKAEVENPCSKPLLFNTNVANGCLIEVKSRNENNVHKEETKESNTFKSSCYLKAVTLSVFGLYFISKAITENMLLITLETLKVNEILTISNNHGYIY